MLEEIIKESLEELEVMEDEITDEFILDCYQDDLESLSEDLNCTIEEAETFLEDVKKAVTSTGDISRVRSRKLRSRRAALTTGLTKSQLKRRARKAAKTRKRSPGSARKATKKMLKAMKRRKAMGI